MNRYEQNTIIKGYVKRIGITILCCLPMLIIIGYMIRNLNSVATVAIFTLFMAVVILAVSCYVVPFVWSLCIPRSNKRKVNIRFFIKCCLKSYFTGLELCSLSIGQNICGFVEMILAVVAPTQIVAPQNDK